MKTPSFKSQVIHKDEKYTYVLTFEEEFLSPTKHFKEEYGWSNEEYNEIKNNYWFSAKISAYLGQYELGNAYLGCNCYKNLKEILGNSVEECLSGYAPQMIEEAREESERLSTMDFTV